MSWDLAFWKPKRTVSETPTAIYELLIEEAEQESLSWLPVATIKERFTSAFPDIVDDGTELNWEGAGSYFQVSWPIGSIQQHTQGLFVSCGWSLLERPDVISRIREVGLALGCGVFDPQSDEWTEPK